MVRIPPPLQNGATVIMAEPHIFAGYDEYSRDGYVVYNPRTSTFFTRRTVTFDESWRQRHLRLGHLPRYGDNPLLPGCAEADLRRLLQPATALPAATPSAAPLPLAPSSRTLHALPAPDTLALPRCDLSIQGGFCAQST